MHSRPPGPSGKFGLNATYVEALRGQWQRDPQSVPQEWRDYFARDGAQHIESADVEAKPSIPVWWPEARTPTREEVFGRAPTRPPEPAVVDKPTEPVPEGALETMRGIQAKIVENMEASLNVPTATSVRDIPVKVLEENRRVINRYLTDDARPRASFTHIAAWALVRAVQEVPSMNNGFATVDDKPTKVKREDINLGIAVDLPGRDGTRTLVVPNLKAVQSLDFRTFLDAYNDVIARARKGKLALDDFEGTTISLTNPGGLGTVMSNPRLMQGQGTIIAMGRIGYPAEYEATAPATLRNLGIGKVMTVTSTYDHRVVQGAESGAFLRRVHELLCGKHGFYDEVFAALRIPHAPYILEQDREIASAPGMTSTERAMRVSQLIHAYRVRGHMIANSDPLDLRVRHHPELGPSNHNLTIWDLDREFLSLGVLEERTGSLRDILDRLQDAYCRRVGVEYMHINDVEERRWVQRQVELGGDEITIDDKRRILEKLSQAQGFERFLHKRYMGHKRFSVEGAETGIAMLEEGIRRAASHGVTDIIVGMAHRGRLNVLANVVGKSYEAIFAEFEDVDPKTIQGSGDVKYHLGARGTYIWQGKSNDYGVTEEREVRIELACNPSHLEAVNPVVLGQCRARQDLAGDRRREKVVPLLIHGDAAFAGQGVVYESLQMSDLQGYRVGGTVHLVINNQIGYTTSPEKARTSLNCSDIARTIAAPVFRVNGDDPEAAIRVMRIAFDYRMRWQKDVVIDLVCYRRHGHNEGDEPAFTQPILYRAIRQHEPVRDRYAELLLRRGDLAQDDVDEIEGRTFDALEGAFGQIREKGSAAIPEKTPNRPGTYDSDAEEAPVTAVDAGTLKRITEKISYDPKVIDIHPRVKNQVLSRRHRMVFEDGPPNLDFGMAEILAYGSLLLEGIPVRMSGQDCGRGTFAHRHAVLYDVEDGRPYIPLNYLGRTRDEAEERWHPSRFRIYDSPLSEEAVLGFEYGYSVAHPDSLVIWEAQFGDFFNGAQIQVDQFVTSGEAKWGQKSRVVMMLPHGYDGQGPEHSSARVERFLQQCAEENIRVAICSTSAQQFHLLRRQAKQPKRPLILFTHKSLLRSETAASDLDAFSTGEFQTVIDDEELVENAPTKRLVFCTGKIYWELEKERRERAEKEPSSTEGIRIVRIEQLYPFPHAEVRRIVEDSGCDDVVWAQEEPRNMGAYEFINHRFVEMGIPLAYRGRPASASPATGSGSRHKVQHTALLDSIFWQRPMHVSEIPR